MYQQTLKKYQNYNVFEDDTSEFILNAEKFAEEIRKKINIEKGGEIMAKLPDVYQIYSKNSETSYYVYPDNEHYPAPAKEGTWLLEDDATNFINSDNNYLSYEMRKVDPDLVRFEAKQYLINAYPYNETYTQRVMDSLIDALKDEAKGLNALSEAFQPIKQQDLKGGERKSMKENEVPVKFYEGFISREVVSIKNGDKSIPGKRIKMPNDDPTDTRVRRSFVVKEAQIGTDTSNPHMRYVYLNKKDKNGNDIEYRVVRKNYDPETKKSEILEDIKMTAEQIADTFQKERDREYAEWKATQAVQSQTQAEPTDPSEEIINTNSDDLQV